MMDRKHKKDTSPVRHPMAAHNIIIIGQRSTSDLLPLSSSPGSVNSQDTLYQIHENYGVFQYSSDSNCPDRGRHC